ncbi:MAG: DNA recombination protein RmuC [Saprospirales bacterium]|nr:DNA recombination protein RmuC [Saprospirales bacterium]
MFEDAKEKLSLKIAIDQLRDLNTQLSDDANRLVLALKGDNKTQGDWGEYQLEMLLERAGLEKDIHYLTQTSFKDDDKKEKRPDFIVNLPEGKHLIIDCKVSLVAYERFFNAEDETERAQYLKAHVESLRQHVRGLSEKNYQQLHQLQSPDYTLLYVPIEPAFVLAQREDQRIFLDTGRQNL